VAEKNEPEATAPAATAPVPDTTDLEVIVIEEESADSNPPAGAPVETSEVAAPVVPPMETVQGIESNISAVGVAVAPEPVRPAEPAATAKATATAAGAGPQERSADETGSSEAIVSNESVVDPAGETGEPRPAAVPPELETIFAAGAAVDIEKMTLQIPIICLQTWEERAALDALQPMAGTMKRAFYTWSATRGIVREDGTVMGEMYCDPIQALEFVRRQKTNGLYILIDFHNCLEDRKVVRMLREMFDAGETGRGMLVLTGPVIPVPPELGPACQLFDWPPGGAIDFNQVLEEVRNEVTTAGGDAIELDAETRRLLLERVQGMPAGRARFEFLCALRGKGRSGI